MKQKISKAIVIFLIVLLLFTFLSRSAAAATTPYVSLATAKQGSISHAPTSSGKISASKEVAMSTLENLLIKSVAVTVGQEIKQNDPLFEVAIEDLQEKITALKREIETLKLQVTDANSQMDVSQASKNNELAHAKENYQQAEVKGNQAIESAFAEWQKAVTELNQANDETKATLAEAANAKEKAYDDALQSKDEALLAARQAIETANLPQTSSSTAQQTQLTIDEKNEKLSKYQNLLTEKGLIRSNTAGTISEVIAKVGTKTTGSGEIKIADTSASLKLVATFKKEDAKYLSVGGKVQLNSTKSDNQKTNLDQKKGQTTIQANILSVAESEEDKGLIVVTVELPANSGKIGDTLEVNLVGNNQNYEVCIPRSALHYDGANYYVYVTEEKNSVMGNEQVVKRINVTQKDKDEKNVAVEGISQQQKVITDSTKELSQGMRVRIDDK